jgi:hypothetical protein
MPRMAVHGRLVTRICNRRNAESAVYTADNTADYAADETANRSGCSHAYIGTMRDAIRDALCLRRKRESK